MRVLFVCRRIDGVAGGVERMVITLANAMCRRGHSVALLTWDFADAKAFYPMEVELRWHKLNMGDARQAAGWWLRLRRMVAIRRVLRHERPDVVVAFQEGPFLTVALSALASGIPVVAAERNAPQRFDHLRAGRYRHHIFRIFQLARRVTVQFESYREHYPAYLRDRIRAIPNPVQPARITADARTSASGERILLAVGRLSYQKNYQALIHAFRLVADEFSDWRLVIVGDGEQAAELRRLSEALGLSERIEFAGARSDVERYYLSSSLFCMASRWEGFPNALAEALSHGLPAVGFAGCAGVNELIRDGETGLLATGNGDASALAQALRELMGDENRRRRMAHAAIGSMARYAPERVFDIWEAELAALAR